MYHPIASAGCMPSPRQLQPQSTTTTLALEQYRLQLYNYALNIERLKSPQYAAGAAASTTSNGVSPWMHSYNAGQVHCAGQASVNRLSTISLFPQSQRIFQQEEPKPQHSYIGLIAMAILSSSDIKLVLSDIYQYILDNYPYFRTRGPGWRNSIRHNLSLNDCFIKSGRSANGKGHYWAIHPANMEDFRKGDFRRRKAQRKVRKHMGLSVDDASTDSPSPPPLDLTTPPPPSSSQASLQLAAANYPYHHHYFGQLFGRSIVNSLPSATHIPPFLSSGTTTATTLQQRQQIHIQQPESEGQQSQRHKTTTYQPLHLHQHQHQQQHQHIAYINSTTTTTIANLYSQTRKRQFDVASLLAPDVQIVDVDIVEDDARTTRQTQHTVITKVQVQKQQTIHRELVVEPPSDSPLENVNTQPIDTDGDPDVDVDGDDEQQEQKEDCDHEHHTTHSHHHLSTEVFKRILSPADADNNSYLCDGSRQFSFDGDIEEHEESEQHNFTVSMSPILEGSSVASSQHDSNSLEECSMAVTASATSTLPSISLPKAYVDLSHHVDPQILSRYYGTYMAAAARRASLEATRTHASLTPPPHIEMVSHKS
ncbi:uncharacterized protein LOC108607349 [Drosophila busckii]|nr:uncharacterized protein LOC108607349 [Drosophila busckii]